MRLLDAAAYFDRVVFDDAYTRSPVARFKGQLDLFDDSKRDGATVARRVISVAGNVTLPARGVVTAHGENFIVGGLHQDSFDNQVIRKKYVCHRADGLAGIYTTEQAIAQADYDTAYAARLWVKDLKEIETSSKLHAFFNIFLSPSEDVGVGSVITLDGRAHMVRGSFISAAGFRLCEADELTDDAVTTVTYTRRNGQAYDSAADTLGASDPASIPALWHRFQSGYAYAQAAADKYEPGDITVNVLKADVATAGPGDTLTLAGKGWRVLSAYDSGVNVWILHCRHV